MEVAIQQNSWKILLIDDDEDDYVLTRVLLSEAKAGQFNLEWAPSYNQAIHEIRHCSPDAILVDYDLGIRNGLDLVRELRAEGYHIPMILLTGRGSYEIDVEAMRAGVSDYLNKDETTAPLLERTIRYAIERKQTEEALRQANDRLVETNVLLGASNALLAQAKDELEMRVQERTQELWQANAQLRENAIRVEGLAELSRLLAEAVPDFQRVLDTVSHHVSAMIGDACVVSLLSEDNRQIQTMSVYHPDPQRSVYLAGEAVAGVRAIESGLRGEVVRTGQPLLFPSADEAPDRIRASLEQFGMFSLMIVPIKVQNRVIGTLGLSRDKPEKLYTKEDQIFLEDLATRVALAITIVRLFQTIQNELVERKRVEAELAEIQRRLLDSVEVERLQFAQDLHDGPMQDLYGLVYQASFLLNAGIEDVTKSMVIGFKQKVQDVIDALRAIAGELRPPSLTPFGLEKAIRSHVENIQQAQPDLKILLDLIRDGQILSERVRLSLFRIYQVAVMNVVRHAQASQVTIRFQLDEDRVMLEIADNGCGFQLPGRWIDLARQGHLGLVGAFERAEAIGGTLLVQSNPGEGTKLQVIVPRTPHQEEDGWIA